ncbi:MAG: CYTH domain-containing protein, partial [Alphaproteobacteria bacterium]
MSRAADARPNAERELALALGAVDPAQVAAHPLVTALAIDKAVSERLVSTYYDTADRALIADAIVLRVRRTPAGLVQTVKRGGPKGAGLAARDEWETPLDDPAPQWPVELPGAVGARLARAAARGPVAPVFVTDFTRSRRRLATPGGDVVELAIDIGVLRSGEHSRPIAEIELELKHGSAAGLFELALGLTESLPLTLQIVSKG